MLDKSSEELAFPALFPKGWYEYSSGWQVVISPVKYFNARFQHYSGRPSATNAEYNFFAQFIIEQKKVSDSINNALKKVYGQSVTASQLRASPYRLVNLICEDQAYVFLRKIPTTPRCCRLVFTPCGLSSLPFKFPFAFQIIITYIYSNDILIVKN